MAEGDSKNINIEVSLYLKMFQDNLFLRRLSCVDQVQVDMLCQAHADKLVTISPKIKNLHSHLVNDLVIVSYQKH